MKATCITLLLITVSVISFSQTFYIHTAKASGFWSDSANWTSLSRTDGVRKHKFIIPKDISITVDKNVDNLGDVEINISGNLSLAGSTNMQLSNNSSIILNNGSITGNEANQKIQIGSQVKYKGSVDGILTGYWKADNTTGSAPGGFLSLTIMPVNFKSFNINKSGNNIQLTWSTDRESNNNHFEIERSFDGKDWNEIAIVLATTTITSTNHYNYTDKNVSNAVVYYRLRQVDVDGRFKYSSVKTIRLGEATSAVKIYGSEKTVVIDVNTSIKNAIVVSVMNSNGQVITRQSYSNPSYRINVNLPNVASGAYVVHVSDNKGWSEVKKVIL